MLRTALPDKEKKRQATTLMLIVSVIICMLSLLLIMKIKGVGILLHSGPCLFRRFCHLYCPGCGGTRAVRHLLNGEIAESVLSNPIPVYTCVMVFRMLIASVYNNIAIIRNKKLLPVLTVPEIWGIMVVVFGNFIVRNVLLVLFHFDYLEDLIIYYK